VEEHALTLPEVAIQHSQDGQYVFVLQNGKAERRDVKLSRLQEGLAVIESGLEAGEQVAVDGMVSLSQGSAVKIQQP
jgi:hypothetical protein